MDALSAVDWSTFGYFATSVCLGLSLLVFLGVQFDKDQRRKSTIGIKDEVSLLVQFHDSFSNHPTFI